jgi:hypothetical protein
MRQNLDVNFATLSTPIAAMFALTNELRLRLARHGHDWLLWQAVNKYVMASFGDTMQPFCLITPNNLTFRFGFEPADSNGRHAALQVMQVGSDAQGKGVDRLVWHMPIVFFAEPTPALDDQLYPIEPSDAAIIRALFLSGQVDRAQVSRVLARSSNALLQAAE